MEHQVSERSAAVGEGEGGGEGEPLGEVPAFTRQGWPTVVAGVNLN